MRESIFNIFTFLYPLSLGFFFSLFFPLIRIPFIMLSSLVHYDNPLSYSPPMSFRARSRYSLTNNVYKSLQDNNEDQCIIMLGESGSGKTENCRMVVKFLSKMSGRHCPIVLQRQKSSSSIASNRSTPNSSSSTPKHNKSLSATTTSHHEKSTLSASCFRSDSTGRGKKSTRVEFVDLSYQKLNDIELAGPKFCPKHNCCNNNSNNSGSSSTTTPTTLSTNPFSSSNPIDIPKRLSSTSHDFLPAATSKSFSIYETMNRVYRSKSTSTSTSTSTTTTPNQPTAINTNCVDAIVHTKCDSLDLISSLPSSNRSSSAGGGKCSKKISGELSSSLDESTLLSRRHSSTTRINDTQTTSNNAPNPTNPSVSSSSNHITSVIDIKHFNNKQLSYDRNKINLDNFKSAKRKVPIGNLRKLSTQLNNLEIQTMRERIAQAHVFLEAMGCASTGKNRDSSRFVSRLIIRRDGAQIYSNFFFLLLYFLYLLYDACIVLIFSLPLLFALNTHIVAIDPHRARFTGNLL